MGIRIWPALPRPPTSSGTRIPPASATARALEPCGGESSCNTILSIVKCSKYFSPPLVSSAVPWSFSVSLQMGSMHVCACGHARSVPREHGGSKDVNCSFDRNFDLDVEKKKTEATVGTHQRHVV